MCEKRSHEYINTSAVNQAVFCTLEVSKNHYEKEKISACSSQQCRDQFFRMHLKETWLLGSPDQDTRSDTDEN